MSKKQFTFIKDTVAPNIKTPIVFNNETMSTGEVLSKLNELSDENEHYKSIFFELVETTLKDENCRELYCKGILDIFNKANSLNQSKGNDKGSFRMTEKRFEIKPSVMYNNKYVIHDSKKEYTFPVLDSTLSYMFCKALNELSEEKKELQFQCNYLQEGASEFLSWSKRKCR
ncbi:MAG: hypothetical protein KIG63_07785 [Methanobrevibacter sp.]|nr:hypothetical protein [Methanobrevibacter sp.]